MKPAKNKKRIDPRYFLNETTIKEAPIPYTRSVAPEKRYRGYESPEEVGLPPKSQVIDPPRPEDIDPGGLRAAGDEAGESRARRVKHKTTLADQLEQAESMLAQMDSQLRHAGQVGPEELAKLKAGRERWEKKRAQLSKIMLKQGIAPLAKPLQVSDAETTN